MPLRPETPGGVGIIAMVSILLSSLVIMALVVSFFLDRFVKSEVARSRRQERAARVTGTVVLLAALAAIVATFAQ